MDAAAADPIRAPKRKPTSLRLWLVWLGLSIACYGGFFAVMTMPPFYSLVMSGFVDLVLFNRVIPGVGMLALAAPWVGLILLIIRTWRPAALAVIAFCALSLIAYAGYVQYKVANPPAASDAGVDGWRQ